MVGGNLEFRLEFVFFFYEVYKIKMEFNSYSRELRGCRSWFYISCLAGKEGFFFFFIIEERGIYSMNILGV